MPDRGDERFRLAFESAPTAMILVDEEGRIVLANAQTEKLFGYSRAELLGSSIDRLVPERFRSGHPGHRGTFFREPRARSMGAGRDLFGRRKDGTEVPVEIGLNPIRTDEGSFVLAAVVDISERRRAEERFRIAVESAPNAMLMVDEGGRIVLVNVQAERLFGYSRGELIGSPVDLLVPGRFRARHPQHRAEFGANPHARPMGAGRDLRAVRKDGSEVPVEIGLNPIRTAEGSFVLAAVVDISGLKRMQEELVRTQSLAALGEMAATVAHEVRNPLAAISGPLQVLVEDLSADDPRREVMGEVLKQVKRLDGTVSGLLSLARPATPQKRPVAVRELVERIARQMGEHEQGRRARFHIQGGEGLLWPADPDLLEQVLWNLFLNAGQAMKDGGSVAVTLRADAREAELLIADDGAGIPPDLLPRVFRPFVTTKPSGTGLGLPLCRKIVEAHGGSIEIASEPGRGTTVRIRLPRD